MGLKRNLVKNSIFCFLFFAMILYTGNAVYAYSTTYDSNYRQTGYHLEILRSWTCEHRADTMSTIECNCTGLNVDDVTIDNSVHTQLADGTPAFQISSKWNAIQNDYTGIIGLNPVGHYMEISNVGNGNSYNKFGFTVSRPYGREGNETQPNNWGYAYFGIGFSYCANTGMYYFVDTYHTWFGLLNGSIGINENHQSTYSHTVTLYNIVPNAYTITYNAGEGTGSISSQIATYDTNIALSTNVGLTPPTGKHFVGWKDNATGITYSARQSVSNLTSIPNGTVTLAAQYDWNTYNVVYNPNCSTVKNITDMDPYELSNVSYDSSIKIYDNKYIRDGYAFVCWKDQYGKTYTPSKGTYSTYSKLTTVSNDTVRLYAQWTPITYTVKYDANGGSRTIASQSFTYNDTLSPQQTQTLQKNTFTRTNYLSGDWNTKADGSGTTFGSYGVIPTSQLIANAVGTTITLYSKWNQNAYYICYKYDNSPSSTQVIQTVVRNVSTKLQNTAMLGFSVKTYSGWNISSTGFKFLSWNSSNTYDGTWYSNMSSVTNLANTGQTVTLYGRWFATLYYDKNFSTTYQSPVSQSIYEDTSFLVKTNGFTSPIGYAFTGWNTKIDGTGTAFYSNTRYDKTNYAKLGVNNGSAYLYAQWKPITYTIRFAPNGGSGSMNDMSMTYDVSTTLPTCGYITPYGKLFAGWKDNATGNVYTDMQSIINLASTDGTVITLTAQWKDNTYTVKYDANGGSGSMADQTFLCNVAQPLNNCIFTAPIGKKFTGWNTKADGTGTPTYTDKQSVNNLTTVGNTITLYAQWSTTGYTIHFDANSGSGFMSDYSVFFGKSFILPKNQFSLYGFNFSYWSISPQYLYTVKQYIDKGFITSDLGTADSIITLYAHWQELGFDIVYDANGGSGHMDMDCWNYTEDWHPQDITFDSPTGTETFEGWNTKPDGTGMSFDPETSYNDARDNFIKDCTSGYSDTSNPVLTLYAQWSGSVPDQNYMIIYDDNGAACLMAPQIVACDATVKLSKNQFEKYFNQFQGWNTMADGSGTVYADEEVVKNLAPAGTSITLYAQWENYINLKKGRFLLTQYTFMRNGKVIYDIKSKFANDLPNDTLLDLQVAQERYENQDYLQTWVATKQDTKRYHEELEKRIKAGWEGYKYMILHLYDYVHIVNN